MDVYVFKNQTSFVPYALLHAWVDLKHPAGYYRSAEYVKLCALTPDQMFSVAMRAYIADIALTTFPTAPPFVQNGLGQIYGAMTLLPETIEIGRPNPAHVALLRRVAPIPVAALFSMAEPAPPGDVVNAPSVFEAESWALMHYLLIGNPELRPNAVSFLKALSTGTAARAAFDAAFGPAFMTEIDAALHDYIMKPSMTLYALPTSEIVTAPPGDPVPLSRRDTLYHLGWLLANIDEQNAPQAEAHFRAALAIDPADAKSLAGLGWIRSRAKKYEDAAPFFEQAMGNGSSDAMTLTLAGRNLLAQYGATRTEFDAPKTFPDTIARARALLEKAAAACPTCAEAQAALGATYLYDPAATAPGIAAIETALTLAPPRADELLNLVSLYARQGDRPKGQAIIDGPIAALGDTSATASGRERLAFADLALINQKIAAGDLDGALAMLKAARDTAPTPRLRARMESEIARIEPVAMKNRQVMRFNDAVSLANLGDWKGAGEICDALLQEPLEETLRPRVLDLQRKAKAAPTPRKK
jgi:tetratricopeptide (TPR) repeat protein